MPAIRLDPHQARRRTAGQNGPMDGLLPSPAVFDAPLEVIDDSHLRIRRHCATLMRLAQQPRDRGPDSRAAAAAVVRFFDGECALHHRDENDDLFPALHRFAPSADLNAVDALIARLRADHAKLEALWSDLRPRLLAAMAGDASQLDAAAAADFASAHERHMALEESTLLPLARRVLDERVIASVARRMARRRA
jgi:hemerythrin-like domain-containing protein